MALFGFDSDLLYAISLRHTARYDVNGTSFHIDPIVMKAYRLSVNLKLGLVLFAMFIAVASIVYTNSLVDRLRDREQFLIRIWAAAVEQIARAQPVNPYEQEFSELIDLIDELRQSRTIPGNLDRAQLNSYESALWWARAMPTIGDSYLASLIVAPVDTTDGLVNFGIPAILLDSSNTAPQIWRNVFVPDTLDLSTLPPEDSASLTSQLIQKATSMAAENEPIKIVQVFGPGRLVQNLYYGESRLIKELRIFPYVQLLFVSMFILVGYFGFSYIRRSEQSSLWVGMAKEAAHQLGTPISSLMGWLEILRMRDLPPEQEHAAMNEIENDINRLRRVASRFSDIGSLPKLEVIPLAPVITATSDYMKKRIPQQGKRVTLNVTVPEDIYVPVNAELFEWVIENLLKNALDAIETNEGEIDITAQRIDERVMIDVRDTGKGIDRRQWRNIFRPGYSTKKRGWGLGLSLAKRIVEDYHGGSLSLAQSRIGHGSTFRIELPVK